MTLCPWARHPTCHGKNDPVLFKSFWISASAKSLNVNIISSRPISGLSQVIVVETVSECCLGFVNVLGKQIVNLKAFPIVKVLSGNYFTVAF